VKYLSVCSGIEAATVAWHDLGWQPVGFSEIEKFPSALLQHHYPNTVNFGDMTNYKEWNIEQPDILVGGTPCQSFSVAGLRKGLDDPRGNLALVYCGILDHFRPTWFVWENVPGVLSSAGGRDFGSFLGALAELGYGFAYRVLDAQFFGVAQRRRRVFVVGYLGDWRPPAAVLFERQSLCRDTAPSREKRESIAGSSAQCFEPRSPDGHARLIGDFAPTLNRMGGGQREPCVMTWPVDVAPALNAHFGSKQGLEDQHALGGAGLFVPAQPIPCHPLATGAHIPAIANTMAVRRLTPVECERLQGFPDNYTNIPWRKKDESPDGPRYKALGNSMAVPVMQWIGKNIKKVSSDLLTS
jgi:DNA (cytosine-5)-methyltransferase 1